MPILAPLRTPIRTPVFQTRFCWPGGNCYAACLATLLGLPLEIPDAAQIMSGADDDSWFARAQAFVGNYGYRIELSRWSTDQRWPLDEDELVILSGPSPRGDWWHATVAANGRILHDPHPDNTGLRTELREIERLIAI